jgi:hypothetical protein
MSTPEMDHWWRNMAKSLRGVLEKPAMLFAMFFDLGMNTLSNITPNLFFGDWAAARGSTISM